ncbi:hypothetical protein BHU72_05185 [Desulfuribacillus stibiiarsenatis]|uniref:ABC transporter ATP-binding protein n=1 Tax=Desulfuribacillus stibiiarsenatis TaxID=1390249 RepID=A0A1E5L5T7_9FIRM|nr:ABC transporter ATP-binding protein [Desulfuribacillus stibiiarsenatis]OEH85481.1 hypothetical protein BHU72_05185 [Desulfuribacillus stibiiarsenatis]
MINVIIKLKELFNKRQKTKYITLLFMMLLAALLETVGIGLIVPFISLLTNQEIIYDNTIIYKLYSTFNFHSKSDFLTVVTIIFFGVFLIKNLYLLLFIYIQNRIIYNEQIALSIRLFESYLKKPYEFHVQRNTADLQRNINIEVGKFFSYFIIPLSMVAIEILTATFIFILLLYISPIPTLVTIIILGTSAGVFLKLVKKKIYQSGIDQQISNGDMIKWVNQGLGAGKEVKVKGIEDFFVKKFSKESVVYAKAARYHSLLYQSPRLFIETVLIATVLIICLMIVVTEDNISSLVATLALFAMAAVRLVPSINRIVSSLNSMRYSIPAFDVIYNDLIDSNINHEQPIYNANNNRRLEFERCIRVENVTYRYPNSNEDAIINVSFQIPKGKAIGVVGASGSGKTTIIDILLGIYNPTKGKIFIDNRNIYDNIANWQKNIGYIPQTIYLSDDTIRNNIAFGKDEKEIDDSRIWRALEQAQLKGFVEGLQDNLDTFVGENGVRLSGGQRQRIGIARALYDDPEILFLDEATSALDTETEYEIMRAINELKGFKTLIIIAHRLSTIEQCDYIVKMNKGKVEKV